MRTIFSPNDNTASSEYNESLIRGVILNEKLARMCPDTRDVISFNSACVIFAVAYLEASLNQIISGINNSGSSADHIPVRFWELIKEKQKSLKVRDKWDFIAAAYGGMIWDSSKEPFQSFEIINSLRNELIHFKGERVELGKAPTKKLNVLLKEFQGGKLDERGQAIREVMGNGQLDWTFQLLSSELFGRWVAKRILEFDLGEKKLLFGKELSETDKAHYWMKWDQVLFAAQTPSDFTDIEKALTFLEKVILPASSSKDIEIHKNLWRKLCKILQNFRKQE